MSFFGQPAETNESKVVAGTSERGEFKRVEDMEADENGVVAWFSAMEQPPRGFVSACTAFPYFSVM